MASKQIVPSEKFCATPNLGTRGHQTLVKNETLKNPISVNYHRRNISNNSLEEDTYMLKTTRGSLFLGSQKHLLTRRLLRRSLVYWWFPIGVGPRPPTSLMQPCSTHISFYATHTEQDVISSQIQVYEFKNVV